MRQPLNLGWQEKKIIEDENKNRMEKFPTPHFWGMIEFSLSFFSHSLSSLTLTLSLLLYLFDSFSMTLCVSDYLSPPSLSVSIWLFLYDFLCLWLSFSPFFKCLTVSLSHSPCLSLYLSVCLPHCLRLPDSLFLCMFVCFSLSLSLTHTHTLSFFCHSQWQTFWEKTMNKSCKINLRGKK